MADQNTEIKETTPLSIPEFLYGNNKLNRTELAELFDANVDAYLDTKSWSSKKKEKFMNAYREAIRGIQNGTINDLDLTGELGGFSNDKDGWDAHGHVVNFIRQGVHELYNRDETNSTTSKETKYNLSDAFKKEFFGGNDPSLETYNSWLDRDLANELGLRGIDLRRLAYSAFLDKEIKNGNDLTALRDALNSGDINKFYQEYAKYGDVAEAKKLFSTGEKAEEEDFLAKDLEAKRAELKAQHYTDLLIEDMLQLYLVDLANERENNYRSAMEDRDWNDYAAKTFTSNANKHWSLNNYNNGEARGDAFWTGNIGNASGLDGKPGEYDKESYFEKHQDAIDEGMRKINSGEDLSDNDVGNGISESELMMASIYYDIKKNPNDYIPTASGAYIIKSSIRPDGSAYRYNPKTRTLYKFHNLGKETPKLNEYYKNKWLEKRKVQSKYRNGGKLAVLKALSGASMAQMAKQKMANDKKKVEKEAKDAGRSYDLYRAGNRHVKVNGEWLLSDSDWARLGSIGLDAAGLVSSLTGWGDIVNLGTNIGSIGLNVYADAADDAMTTGEKWLSGATQVGLSVFGMIPGMESFKILNNARKIANPILKGLKYFSLAHAGLNLGKYIDVWSKVAGEGENNRLTANDWKTLAESTKVISNLASGGIRSLKGKHFGKLTDKKLLDIEEVKTDKITTDTKGKGWFKTKAIKFNDWRKNWLNGKKDGITNLWRNARNNDYNYNRDKVSDFQAKFGLNGKPATTTSVWDKIFYGTGRFSDAGMWNARLNYKFKPVFIDEGNYHESDVNIPHDIKNINMIDPKYVNVGLGLKEVGRVKRINIMSPEALLLIKQNHPATGGLGKVLSKSELRALRVNTDKAVFTSALKTPNGIVYWWKQGGKVQQLKSLRQGGILKAQGGTNSSSMHGITSDPRLWRLNVFMPRLRGLILADLKTGKITVDEYNNYQSSHAGSYRAASANNNDFYTTAYRSNNSNVADLERQFQGWGYNDIAIAPGEKNGRYTVNGKNPYSGDSQAGGWKEDNLYSGKHDDRRPLGREGDWDESSDEFKAWQADLGKLGLETYLDEDKYYKLRRLPSKELTPNSSNPSELNPVGFTGSRAHGVPEGEDNVWEKRLNQMQSMLQDANPYRWARFVDGLRTNKKIKDIAQKRRTSNIEAPEVTRYTYAPIELLNNSQLATGQTMSEAGRMSNTNNGETSRLTKLQAAKNAREQARQAYIPYAEATENSKEKNWEQQARNLEKDVDKRNENMARDTQLYNVNEVDVPMTYENANYGSRSTLSKELEYDWKTSHATGLDFRQLMLQARYNKNLLSDPAVKAAYDKYQNSGTLADLTAYEKAVENYNRKNDPILYNNIAKLRGLRGFMYEDDPFGVNKAFTFTMPVEKAASGGKITDDGPKRSRHKDADRFRKMLKDAADMNDKKLERLSRATILELKRAIGK